ncbi:MAG: hypothetical protein GF364_14130, partial [Candidatus Lokiarchaeota archaeon]|nr:hypothetical protein [Candidatus Lokiarchaeota archaeon]
MEYGKFVLDFFEKYPELKKKVKGWKACLTGPFTLAGEILITEKLTEGKRLLVYQEPRAIMSGKLVNKLAEMMANIAEKYNEMGADIISMDEPTLGLIVGRRRAFFHKDDAIIDILDKAIDPIDKYSSIHVCGNVSPKLRDILLNSKVSIMDHEFANGSNEGIFEKQLLEDKKKILAYGVLISNVKKKENAELGDYVENIKEIETRIEKAVETVGRENLIFKPDCG